MRFYSWIIIGTATIIKLMGRDLLDTFSTILTILSLAPTIIFTIWGFPAVFHNFQRLTVSS